MNKLHLEFLIKIGEERTKVLEQWVEMQVQPKPWWVPNTLWKRILGRVLLISMREVRK